MKVTQLLLFDLLVAVAVAAQSSSSSELETTRRVRGQNYQRRTSSGTRIVGGTAASEGQYPFVGKRMLVCTLTMRTDHRSTHLVPLSSIYYTQYNGMDVMLPLSIPILFLVPPIATRLHPAPFLSDHI